MAAVALPIPQEWVDTIAAAVLEQIDGAGSVGGSPWMTRARAAEYLDVPVSRLDKDRTVPAHRWDGRVLYHRAELDAHLLGLSDR